MYEQRLDDIVKFEDCRAHVQSLNKFVAPLLAAQPRLQVRLETEQIRGLIQELNALNTWESRNNYELRAKGTLGSSWLGVGVRREGSALIFCNVDWSGRAAKAGIVEGDLLDEIEHQSTAHMSLYEAVMRLENVAGAKVSLTVTHRDAPSKTVDVVVSDVIRPALERKTFDVDGVFFKLNRFAEETKVEANAQATKAVIDLRHTWGEAKDGQVDALAAQFDPFKQVVTIVGRRASASAMKLADRLKAGGALIVADGALPLLRVIAKEIEEADAVVSLYKNKDEFAEVAHLELYAAYREDGVRGYKIEGGIEPSNAKWNAFPYLVPEEIIDKRDAMYGYKLEDMMVKDSVAKMVQQWVKSDWGVGDAARKAAFAQLGDVEKAAQETAMREHLGVTHLSKESLEQVGIELDMIRADGTPVARVLPDELENIYVRVNVRQGAQPVAGAFRVSTRIVATSAGDPSPRNTFGVGEREAYRTTFYQVDETRETRLLFEKFFEDMTKGEKQAFGLTDRKFRFRSEIIDAAGTAKATAEASLTIELTPRVNVIWRGLDPQEIVGAGNGDGLIQPGERFRVNVALQNNGEIDLPEQSYFLEWMPNHGIAPTDARFSLPAWKKGESVQHGFDFIVPVDFKPTDIDLGVRLTNAFGEEYARRDVRVSLQSAIGQAATSFISAGEPTPYFASPLEGAVTLGTVQGAGAATYETGDRWGIELTDGTRAFVGKSDVSSGAAAPSAAWWKTVPTFELQGPWFDMKFHTATGLAQPYLLNLRAGRPLSQMAIIVNGVKRFWTLIPGEKTWRHSDKLTLVDGVNRVEALATDDSGTLSRAIYVMEAEGQ